MKKIVVLILIALLHPLIIRAQTNIKPQLRPLAFTNVTVVDVASGVLKPQMTVVVSGNRITNVGRKVKIPKGAEIIDAGGKYLIPGLWDMHVHMWHKRWDAPSRDREAFLNLFIPNGITGVRDLGGDLEQINAWRREIAQGARLGPRIFAGAIVDGPPKTQSDYILVTTPDEAVQTVRTLQKEGADFVKVYNNLSRDSYFALAEESRRIGMEFAGHLPTLVTALEASRAGQKSIEHSTWLAPSCSTDEEAIRKELNDVRQRRAETPGNLREQRARMMETYSAAKLRTLSAELRKNQTWVCPTLMTMRLFLWKNDQPFFGDPRIKYVPDWMRERLSNFDLRKGIDEDDLAPRKQWYRYLSNLVAQMHKAGVQILAGTDTLFLNIPGFGLHEELALLVDAGLTPAEALQTATINPAKFLNLEDSLGTVERGKLADLVLLEANPLANISNTQRISAVVVNGRYLPKETLQKLLVEVETAANKVQPR